MSYGTPPISQMPGGNGPLRPHRGVMILVFGILSWLTCFIFGILAWVLGNSDLREMEAGRMDPSGESLTKAGKIIGMIQVILSIVAIPIAIILAMLGVFASRMSHP